ncbi:MAG TPA: hypothetical protein VFV94_07845 [Polyangiaceae bacterium]|nr:hypothetical protein [Polyangiaceae bacterium]
MSPSRPPGLGGALVLVAGVGCAHYLEFGAAMDGTTDPNFYWYTS